MGDQRDENKETNDFVLKKVHVDILASAQRGFFNIVTKGIKEVAKPGECDVFLSPQRGEMTIHCVVDANNNSIDFTDACLRAREQARIFDYTACSIANACKAISDHTSDSHIPIQVNVMFGRPSAVVTSLAERASSKVSKTTPEDVVKKVHKAGDKVSKTPSSSNAKPKKGQSVQAAAATPGPEITSLEAAQRVKYYELLKTCVIELFTEHNFHCVDVL